MDTIYKRAKLWETRVVKYNHAVKGTCCIKAGELRED